MKFTNTRYAFITAYLKGEESRCVSAEHIDAMLQKTTIQDALFVIRGTDIGRYLEGNIIKTFDEADEFLWKYLGRCLDRLFWLKPPPEFARLASLYSRKYDVLNIKIALRKILTGQYAPLVPLGIIYNFGFFERISDAEGIDEVTDIIEKCKLDDYALVTRDIKERDIKERDIKEKDIISAMLDEIQLDKLYYTNLINEMANMNDGSLLAKALGIIIDFINLKMLFKHSVEKAESASDGLIIEGGYLLTHYTMQKFLPLKINEAIKALEHTDYYGIAQEAFKNYEKEEDMTAIDMTLDTHSIRLLKELISPRVLSPCIIFWYLLVKEMEIRNTRLILKAIADGIPSPEIKSYVVVTA